MDNLNKKLPASDPVSDNISFLVPLKIYIIIIYIKRASLLNNSLKRMIPKIQLPVKSHKSRHYQILSLTKKENKNDNNKLPTSQFDLHNYIKYFSSINVTYRFTLVKKNLVHTVVPFFPTNICEYNILQGDETNFTLL